MTRHPTVVVVGSGPNGLAAAIELARSGRSVRVLEASPTPGGGCRTVPMPGFEPLLRDPCAAVHPLAAASPFFRARPSRHRPELLHARFELAHLVGPSAPDHRPSTSSPSQRTASALVFPRDLSVLGDVNDRSPWTRAWSRAFTPLSAEADGVVESVLGARPNPRALVAGAGFAATMYRELLASPDREVASAFAGMAAHAITPPARPVSFGSGLLLAATVHARGWPIPRGGSGAIIDGLLAELAEFGVAVECGVRVGSVDSVAGSPLGSAGDLDAAIDCESPVVLAVGAAEAARILTDSRRVRRPSAVRWLAAMPRGGAAARVDFALDGPVPWRDSRVDEAGTVHLTGTAREVAHAEREIARGRLPSRPPVLLSQPWTADPGRLSRSSRGADRVLWSYAHVPHGYTGSVVESVTSAIEEHAPGFRDVVVGTHESDPQALEAYNASYLGGDIAAGAATIPGMAHRASTGFGRIPGVDGVWLCGASTFPGPGVHGMSGVRVAAAVNKYLR